MNFKNFLRKALVQASRSQPLNGLLWHPLWRLSGFVQRQRRWNECHASISVGEAIERIIPDNIVRHGPFKGMRYPNARSSGSTLFPKLLGSYERELHPLIEVLSSLQYSDIADIGCAEGYYAIGLALRNTRATVHAFDTDEGALQQCASMARLNAVESRAKIGKFCDQTRLGELALRERLLVVADCEGFEKELFDSKTVRALANHDVLIEVHDFRDPTISGVLLECFAPTHKIEVIRSIPDHRRSEVYRYSELEQFDHQTRMALLAELRPADMEWFFFRSSLRG